MTKEERQFQMRNLREVYLGNAVIVHAHAEIATMSEVGRVEFTGMTAFSGVLGSNASMADLQADALKRIEELEEQV